MSGEWQLTVAWVGDAYSGGNEMDTQRTGRIFGWLFIATFITSIPARILFVEGLGASWDDMRFVPGDLSDTSLKVGAILDFLLIGFNIATAVVIYPLVKRLSATLALGYVTARMMETVFIAIGVISIVSVLGRLSQVLWELRWRSPA